MKYVKKVCRVCGSEFFVLKNVEEKSFYCTLECLGKAQIASGKFLEERIGGEI
jgi:hypothetical protein